MWVFIKYTRWSHKWIIYDCLRIKLGIVHPETTEILEASAVPTIKEDSWQLGLAFYELAGRAPLYQTR